MKKLLMLGIFLSTTMIPAFSQGVTYQYTDTGVSDATHAEGDKSASATVSVRFKLKDKVAIAIADGAGAFTANSLFQGYVAPASTLLSGSEVLEQTNGDGAEFFVNGAVYSNVNQSEIRVASRGVTLTHTSGESFGQIGVYIWSDEIPYAMEGDGMLKSLNGTDLNGNGTIPKRVYPFMIWGDINPGTLDEEDRAGDYEGSFTITVVVV